jgi:hypothetical protein
MLKAVILISVITVCLYLLTRCSFGPKITYQPENAEILIKINKSIYGHQEIENEQKLWIFSVGGGYLSTFKKDPFDLHYTFGEYYDDARKIISVNARVFKKDASNQFTIELEKEKTDFELEYAIAGQIHKSKIVADTLFKLVPEKITESNYPEDIVFDFKYDIDFKMENYPDELKVQITIKWIDSEKTVDYIVRKAEYKGNKINPKF